MTNSLSANPPIRSDLKVGGLNVPDNPTIPLLEGDGIGPEVSTAACQVLDAAVDIAYQGRRKINWITLMAGERSYQSSGSWLPDETLQTLKQYQIGLKGPLTTPVGEGIRSINVTLRRELDLYACVRPVRWFSGVPSPVIHPEKVDMVVFRENTEDVYAGIEFEMGSKEARDFQHSLMKIDPVASAKIRFPETSAYAIKPISREGSERLVRAAVSWAIVNHRTRLTLVHKGNIMKHTEGRFRSWGYELMEREFGELTYTQIQYDRKKRERGTAAADREQAAALGSGKLMINDIIADAMFEAALLRPQDFDVLATTNLNGDYLSDALAAQVGGIGIAPGANINYQTGAALFEATHGTAPGLAGKNLANPCSLILSGALLFDHIGWLEASRATRLALEKTLHAGQVTRDLARPGNEHESLGTREFTQMVIQNIGLP